MDVNVTLAKIRQLADAMGSPDGWSLDQHDEFVDAVMNLDEWLSRGGFLPDAWQRN